MMKYTQYITCVFIACVLFFPALHIQATTGENETIRIENEQDSYLGGGPGEETLFCEKTIWDEVTETWVDPLTVETMNTIRFNVTICYTGDNLLSNLTIIDELPMGLTYGGNATIPETTIDGQIITWNITDDFLKGDCLYLEFDVNFSQTAIDFTPTLINTVNITAWECGVGQVSDEDTATLIIEVFKTCRKQVWDEISQRWGDETTSEVGDTVRFQIILSYKGNYTLYNIQVKDTLPGGLSYAGNAFPTPSWIHGQDIYWNLSVTLEKGESYIISFDAQVNSDGVKENVASMTADECSGEVVYCTDTATVFVNDVPRICEKEVWDPSSEQWVKEHTATVGDTVRFRITISYEGNYTLYDIRIKDVLPEGLSYADEAVPSPSAVKDNIIYWNLSIMLHDGESTTVEFDANVNSDGIQTNQVTITANECSGQVWTCCDSATVIVEPGCRICEKLVWDEETGSWADETTAEEGDIISFRISVYYWGNYTLYNIKIKDILPEGLVYTGDAVPAPSAVEGQILYWNLSVRLNKGEMASVEFEVEVEHAGVLVNFVSIRANECSGEVLYCTDTATVNAEEEYDLVADAGGPYTGYVGVPIQFTGTVSGGTPPYSYQWYFDDGQTSITKNPSHIYTTKGSYLVSFEVTDGNGFSEMDTADVTILVDESPPAIMMEKPQSNTLYIKNSGYPWMFATVIIGDIDVEVTSFDSEGEIDEVRFYVDQVLKETLSSTPYVWTWAERSFGIHELKVVVFDGAGNSNQYSMTVWKFF